MAVRAIVFVFWKIKVEVSVDVSQNKIQKFDF